jgi:quercetin dioxygenase-like cupin family protein
MISPSNSPAPNPLTLAQAIEFSRGAVVSKTLVDRPTGTVTLFAFDAGQRLSEHTAPFDATVLVIEGQAELTIGGQPVTCRAGQMIIMPANVPHAVNAVERFKMLLIMIRS